MTHITKIAAIKTTTAIWEYDPELPGNRVLGGSLDVIAAIQTCSIKVCTALSIRPHTLSCFPDPSLWSTNRVFRETPAAVQDSTAPPNPPSQQHSMGNSIPYA